MNGFLIIDKPQNFTSFDVVAVLRKLLGVRRIGHTGTLDPMATGVLPVLVGPCCRANELLPIQDKEYIADFALGFTSDTEDIWGNVKESSDLPVNISALEMALKDFRGNILQTPPMVSAVKKDGKRLYELARCGIVVERKPRPITIHNLSVISYDEAVRTGTLMLRCSKGTYVRSLISNIGEHLGTGGIMTGLRRTMASGFTLEQTITLDEARELGNDLSKRIMPVELGFQTLPAVTVTENQARRFANGGALSLERLKLTGIELLENTQVRVYGTNNVFLGLGAISLEKNELAVARLLGGGVEQ